ncbi:hypothetical protein LJC14_04095 [Treponema sp. OttesenSCG-928-L16]|nr:hypothetical protein [Treponema sp. OttesenSCG-928-L16]
MKRPALEDLSLCLGSPGSRRAESFYKPVAAEEMEKLLSERKQYKKKQDFSVNTKRFVYRNTTILIVAAALVLGIGLTIRGIVKSQAEKFTTAGLSPREVVETYYNAFGELNHEVMEACVTNKAGKQDIGMVTNLFVISRVRQAYEMTSPLIPAEEWIEAGSFPTESMVFGVSGLSIRELPPGAEDNARARFSAVYTLWIPEALDNQGGEMPLEDQPPPSSDAPARHEPILSVPVSHPCNDILHLEQLKGNWRITSIERN